MIENIIDSINETIIGQLTCKLGTDFPVKYFGLVSPVQVTHEDSDSDGSIPGVIANDGECYYPFSDDDYSAGWYHRLLQKTYSRVSGFGDNDIDVETAEVKIVCWGFSNQLNMSAYEFEQDIIIPSIPQKAMLVSSDFDSYQVIQNEFRGISYLNKPEEFVISVRYKVQYTFNRKCKLETNCK